VTDPEPDPQPAPALPDAPPAMPELPPVPEEPGQPAGLQWRRFAFLTPLAVLLVILNFVQLPYFVFEPGPASDVEPLIRVEGHQTFPSQGHLLLTAVHLFQPNVYQLVREWLDDAQVLVPEDAVLGPDETPGQELVRAVSQMDQSQIDAAVVALTDQVGYPAMHGAGALVEDVVPGSPAEGKLFIGDLIVSIDGQSVSDVDGLTAILATKPTGQDMTFRVQAGGETTDVTVAKAQLEGFDNPIVGFAAVDNFPFSVNIDAGGIGGPSAGLMWTLGLIDLLTPGDMTNGRIIAGTGTIALDGTVGPIGGIAEKVVAAKRAGAVIFFAPVEDAPSAARVDSGITVVPVSTYQQALDYLKSHP
jgi:PDZ domain-containing protein